MAKGPSLTWDDRQKIRMIRNGNKNLTPKEMLPLVIEALKRDIAMSTLTNELVKFREYERLHFQNEIDERLLPWSLGSITKYPIPIEVVAILLKINKEEEINIRQAQWIARLSKVTANTHKLWLVAFWFAVYEESWEMSGNTGPCDTSMFDSLDVDEMLSKLFAYIDFERSIYKDEAFAHQEGKRHTPGFRVRDLAADYNSVKDSYEINDEKKEQTNERTDSQKR
jgi:hypothetical protein